MTDERLVRAVGKVAARHEASLTDPFQRELWEYEDGTNDDPTGWSA